VAWRVFFRCASANEAEAQACAEGFRLASQWCPGPTVLETDNARVVEVLTSSTLDRSSIRWTVLEAKEHLQLLIDSRL
jgi:ribonuclease HI